MTFLDLIELLSLSTPLFTLVIIGWKQSGVPGALFGLLTGVILAFICFAGTRLCSRWINRHLQLAGSLSWLLCLGLFVWIFGISLLGAHIVLLYIHHPPA